MTASTSRTLLDQALPAPGVARTQGTQHTQRTQGTRHPVLGVVLTALLAGSVALSGCSVAVSGPQASAPNRAGGTASGASGASGTAGSTTPAAAATAGVARTNTNNPSAGSTATPGATSRPGTGTGTGTSTSSSGSAAPTTSTAGQTQVAGVQVATRGQAGRPGSDNAAVQVYQQFGGSVVNITSLALVRSQATGQAQAQPQGTGSGFILDTQGNIVTNNHVVEDAAQLTVTFGNRATVPATLVGRDPDNDLAVVRVDPAATDDAGKSIRDLLKPVTLGNSDNVVIGETAVAIGSPLGLQQSVTEGIVSALRLPGEESTPGQQLDLLGGAIQTDAAINPGNSGGPLFNAAGEVIGVNSAILSQSGGNIGIGFAIPINVVKRVAPELINTGCYSHPLIGISSVPLSQMGTALKQQLGIPANQRGLLIQDVSAGAQQAGIQAGSRTINVSGGQLRVGGDIITAIDGRPVATGGDVRGYVENNKRPGDTVQLSVLRSGQQQTAAVRLSQRPPAEGVTCR